MAVVYEHEGPASPLQEGDVDGMAELLEGDDDILSTDWDLDFEEPPHDYLKQPPPKA